MSIFRGKGNGVETWRPAERAEERIKSKIRQKPIGTEKGRE